MKFQQLLGTLILLNVSLLFQSCTQKAEVDTEAIISAYEAGSANRYQQQQQPNPNNNALVSPTTPPPAPLSPTPVPVNPVQPAPTPITQPFLAPPAPAPTPVPVAVVNCSEDLEKLNWKSLAQSESSMVALNPIDNFWAAQDGYPNKIYAYGGLSVAFKNPYRTGSQKYFRHAPNYSLEGYSVEIRDNSTGTTVQALESDLSRPHVWSASGQAVMGFIKGVSSDKNDQGAEQHNSISHHFSRSLYDKIKNFKLATITLKCNREVVATGTQDVQSLKIDMSSELVASGNMQGVTLYSYPSTATLGYVNAHCPLEIIAGSDVKCTGGGLRVAAGKWIIDGQVTNNFNGSNTPAVDLSSLSRGMHKIQLQIMYEHGVTDFTNIFLVKIK